jgi:hypothetical protein
MKVIRYDELTQANNSFEFESVDHGAGEVAARHVVVVRFVTERLEPEAYE